MSNKWMITAPAQKVALGAMLIALAFALSWIETLLPLQLWIPLPGVRLGLANIVLLISLFCAPPSLTIWVMFGRCLLQALLFGTVVSLAYSLCGGVCALGIMLLLYRKQAKWFSIYGISIAGAAFHHIGQLACAAWLLHNIAVFSYLPVLLVASLVLGSFTGLIGHTIVSYLHTRQIMTEQ